MLTFSFRKSFDKLRINKFNVEETRIYYFIKNHFRYEDSSILILKAKLLKIIPENVVVTIFYDDGFTIKEKIFLRLDFGNSSPMISKLYPIYIKNKLTYYYSVSYYDSIENNIYKYLFPEMKYALIFSIIVAFLISTIISLIFTINLSNQARKISSGLNNIAGGDYEINFIEKGNKEFSLISKSANIIVDKLKFEKKLRNQWMQDITHDLRTPITALKTQLEGIKDGVLDFSLKRIEKNLLELKRIEDLINDLSELTILESNEFSNKIEDVDINSILNDIKASFLPIINNKNINYIYNSKHFLLNGNKKKLTRAFTNIIDNAIKFTDKDGKIIIKTKKNKNNNIEISIFNSGSFIKDNIRDKIFDRLYRGGYARNAIGTGLGLTIAKKIIDLHNGIIKVDSLKDYGTTFTVII